jgi:hypothetical protein
MNDWLDRKGSRRFSFGLTATALAFLVGLAACTRAPRTGEGPPPPAAAQVPPPASPREKSVALEAYPLIPLRRDLGEFLIDDEQTYVQQALVSVERVIAIRMADKEIQATRVGAGNHRGDHGTPHGCYPAEFTIQPKDASGKAAVGIADVRNHGVRFPSIVRFSNSETTDVNDLRSASIGLALKVNLEQASYSDANFLLGDSRRGVREQDFLTGTNKTFLAKDIKDYSWLFEKRVNPSIVDIGEVILTHPKVFFDRQIAPRFRGKGSAPLLLEKEFFGVLPYAWGDQSVKFKFIPCHDFDVGKFPFDHKDPRYQIKLVSQFLTMSEACYRMVVQVRPERVGDQGPGAGGIGPPADPRATLLEKAFPIEDASVYWPDATAPERIRTSQGVVMVSADFQEVATIRITRGTKALDDQACERLAYSPWNGLKEHQPLGSLSRARLVVYRKSELVRREIYRGERGAAKRIFPVE